MSKHAETFVLPVPIPDALRACQTALAGPGWTVSAQGSDRLTAREVPQPVSWGNPVTVEVALAAADGQTRVSLSGANGGFGPIQTNHVKGRLGELRRAIEAAAVRPVLPETFTRALRVNGERISDETLHQLAQQYGLQVADGNFWYDKVSGAWGQWGGPAQGFLRAGLPLGGPLPREASGGATRVVINGRELHPLDVLGLQRLVGVVLPGRWWTDAAGNFGMEGGPVLGNLWQVYRQLHGAGMGAAGSGLITADGSGTPMYDSTDMFGNYYSA